MEVLRFLRFLLFFGAQSAAQYSFIRGVQYTSPLHCSLRANKCHFTDWKKDLSVKARQLGFGESNCSVTFSNCVVGACYFLVDFTSSIPTDAIARKPPTSIFESVNVTDAEFVWDSQGIQIKPTAPSFTLHYSTYTCQDFYSIRGRARPQLCAGGDLISQLLVGVPLQPSRQLQCKSLISPFV